MFFKGTFALNSKSSGLKWHLSRLIIFWIQMGFECIKGTQVGPLLNVICKIVSFLCNLDNTLLKNVIVFFFGNQMLKWRSFEKRAIFDLLFTFFSHQETAQKFLQHISHLHTYMCFSPYWLFCLPNFAKIANLSCKVSLWCDSRCWFFFRAILEQSINNTMMSKL